jgi:hypothetical protein
MINYFARNNFSLLYLRFNKNIPVKRRDSLPETHTAKPEREVMPPGKPLQYDIME